YVLPPPGLYTVPLHDALPIYRRRLRGVPEWDHGERAVARAVLPEPGAAAGRVSARGRDDDGAASERVPAGPRLRVRRRHLSGWRDRKSTRLNSSHDQSSYAVF